jgi:hypothetical protein
MLNHKKNQSAFKIQGFDREGKEMDSGLKEDDYVDLSDC